MSDFTCSTEQRIFSSFGSKILSKKLGFFYNNELADFSEFWPHVYKLRSDKKVPGKRPMSNASPIIFLDQNGNVSGVFGAAGGHFIPTALVMVRTATDASPLLSPMLLIYVLVQMCYLIHFPFPSTKMQA